MDGKTQVESGTPQMITKKEEMTNLKYSDENVVVTHDDNPPGGGSLHLMRSQFW